MSTRLPCCDFPPPPGVGRSTTEFSRLHREHHARTIDTRPATVPIKVDLHDIYVAIDQLVAHAHNPEISPDLTTGAQTLLARHQITEGRNPT